MDNSIEELVDPLKRWKIAHHLFFVLIQGLILAHRNLLAAVQNNNYESEIAALNLATQLFWGSTAAFKFGTDYTAEDYEKLVRPTMGPPHYSEGFSDLQSIDHSTLLKTMGSLTTFFKSCPISVKPAYQSYLSALHTVYANHAYVCERFVGTQGESLLQKKKQTEKNNTELSAPQSIRTTYRNRTMKLVGVE